MSWPIVLLEEVCDVRRGTTITEKQTTPGEIPVVAGGITNSYTHNVPNRSGMVITVSGSGANAGFVNYWNQPIFASDCSTIQTKTNNIDIRYIYHFLKSKQEFINTTMRSGAAQPHVYAKDLAKIKVPLPPLLEQKRIAAIIDKAYELKPKREQAITKLDKLNQSTFTDMFETTRRDKTYSLRVKDICEFKYGKSLPKKNRVDGNISVYGSNGVVGFHNQFLTNGQTIIIGRKGSCGEINFSDSSCFPIDTTFYIDKTATNQNLIWLRFALERLHLNTMNKSAAVPGLSRDDAYRQVIDVPPIEAQREFEKIIICINKNIQLHKSALDITEKLMASLRHQAFTTGFN